MKQSVTMSMVEAITNVLVGFCVAVLTQMGVFLLFGLQITLAQHLRLGGVFTIVSLVRSFLLRRLFEELRLRTATRNAAGQ